MDMKQTLAEAQKELRALLQQREEIETRIKGVMEILTGLKTLGENPEANGVSLPTTLRSDSEMPPGFTDAVRQIIRHSSGPITAMEIRDELEAGGRGGKTPKHTLISVYTVLSRLKDKGFIKEGRKTGRPAYTMSPMQMMYENLFGSWK